MAVIRLDTEPDVIEEIVEATHETARALGEGADALAQAAVAIHASADRLIEAATSVRTVAEELPGLAAETD